MNFNPTKPFNELPSLPPDVNFSDTDLLLSNIKASDALAKLRLTIMTNFITNEKNIVRLHPLFVPEAVYSSNIEGVTSTNKSMYLIGTKKQKEITADQREVLNYTKALAEGSRRITEKSYLSTGDYIAIQKILKPHQSYIRNLPGTQISNPATKKIYYTPPETEARIRNLLANFERYFNDKSPAHELFARMAILHYQFEAIHPFPDGNGRIGRILMQLYLIQQKNLPAPVLSISGYIDKYQHEYYEKLRNVTSDGNWKDWIIYITNAVTVQATYTHKILNQISDDGIRAQKVLKTSFSFLRGQELEDFLFTHVHFTQEKFENELNISQMTARKYIQKLRDGNVLTKTKETGKNRFIYTNTVLSKLEGA